MIKKPIKTWYKKTKKSFTKKFPTSLINILLIFTATYLMMDFVVGFGIIPLTAYLIYSLVNLNKLIEKPWKSLTWAIIYIISAILFDTFLNEAVPRLSRGDGASIFSGLLITGLLTFLWIRNRKLK